MADIGLGSSSDIFNALERSSGFKIKVNGNVIGTVQSVSIAQDRELTEHFVLNHSEDPAALIPGLVKNKTISCDMFVIWKNSALQSIGGNATDAPALKDQKVYFDVQGVKKKADGSDFVTITFKDCLIKSVSSTYDIGKGDLRVSEKVVIGYRTLS